MLFCHNIHYICIINALFLRNFVFPIYAIFLLIFLSWKVVTANFLDEWQLSQRHHQQPLWQLPICRVTATSSWMICIALCELYEMVIVAHIEKSGGGGWKRWKMWQYRWWCWCAEPCMVGNRGDRQTDQADTPILLLLGLLLANTSPHPAPHRLCLLLSCSICSIEEKKL